MTCPTPQELAEERINRVLTQYRESPNLLFMLRTYLTKVAEVALQVCDLPDKFDIDTAVGDQLTLIGKRLGWPRCHCVCDVAPVFGFECPPGEVSLRPVVGFGGTMPIVAFGFCGDAGGFCEDRPVMWGNCPAPDLSKAAVGSTWAECSSGLSEICLDNDEVYRSFLKVRRFQVVGRYDLTSLEECLRTLFGPSAYVLHSGDGRVVVSPGRDLTQAEILLLQLYPRVLPLALGIELRFHFGERRVFGFGDGWGGFLEESLDLTVQNEGYLRTGKIFGFCEGAGGFCEEWMPLGEALVDEDGNVLVTEDGEPLHTEAVTEGAAWMCRTSAPWMCEIDVQPYSC